MNFDPRVGQEERVETQLRELVRTIAKDSTAGEDEIYTALRAILDEAKAKFHAGEYVIQEEP